MLKKYDSLLNLDATIASDLFLECEHPWEVLPMIELYILRIASKLGDEYEEKGDNVFVHKSTKISDTASISGPCIIGANTEVRPGAYIRGKVIIGDNCIVGNSSELKNAIMFNNAKCPHFNYVGEIKWVNIIS